MRCRGRGVGEGKGHLALGNGDTDLLHNEVHSTLDALVWAGHLEAQKAGTGRAGRSGWVVSTGRKGFARWHCSLDTLLHVDYGTTFLQLCMCSSMKAPRLNASNACQPGLMNNADVSEAACTP